MISQITRGRRHATSQEPSALLRRQPVSEANTDPPHSLDATNSGCQFRTQQAAVGRLVRDASDGSEPKAGAYPRCSR
jgi:hypothetical protein